MTRDPSKRPKTVRAGPGRPSKAEELGLAALIDRAWPPEQQAEAIRHIASMISPALVIKINQRSGEEMIELAVPAKDQIAALRLLLEYKFGKPAQVIKHSGSIDTGKHITEMSDEELTRIIQEG